MGDYYRGDPGFLSFLGGALKTVGGFIPGVGGIVSSIGEKIGAAGSKSAIVKVAETGGSKIAKVAVGAKQIIAKHPVISGLAAAGAVTAGVVGARRAFGGGGGKKHRRMNPCNVRALRRAVRRAHGFERIARRVMRFTSPQRKGRFAGFRKAKKRKC